MKAGEYLSLDELKVRQELARQTIVRGAMEHTAFYPRFYGAAGFEIGDIGKDGWFERLPVVTKKELREHFKNGAAARTGEGDDLWEVEEAVVEQERKWYHTAYFVNENTKSVVSFVN